MATFIRTHINSLLVSLAIVFLAIIVGYFVWGIGYVVMEVNAANNSNVGGAKVVDFNLSGAASLDYRGTLQQP